MKFIFKSEIIDYDFFDNKHNKTIIFLHGWGGNKFSFAKTINILKSEFNILTVTMPTILPTVLAWTLFDYSTLVEQICKLYNIKTCYVVCHSFGLRVATILKEKIHIEKIVITGGAGVKIFNFVKKIEQNNAKILLKNENFKFLYKNIASSDYINLSPINKTTFKNIVNLTTNNLIKFNCPMFLFWGKKDSETKPNLAKFLKRKNKNCKLKFVDSNHFAYLNCDAEFNNCCVRFLCN